MTVGDFKPASAQPEADYQATWRKKRRQLL
jgi:hypothetical protein